MHIYKITNYTARFCWKKSNSA